MIKILLYIIIIIVGIVICPFVCILLTAFLYCIGKGIVMGVMAMCAIIKGTISGLQGLKQGENDERTKNDR